MMNRLRATFVFTNMGRKLAPLFLSSLLVANLILPAYAQTSVIATPLPNAKQTFLDANGNPIVGGKVYHYVPNTTTPKTTWSDPSETTPNANPVTTDSAGRAEIFGQGNYTQKLVDVNGNVQWNAFTTAVGSSSPSGASGTDTAPVGTLMPWSGFTIPTNWLLSYGQQVSRTSYPELLSAITITSSSVLCTTSSTTLSGWVSTSMMAVGEAVEASCIPTGTTIVSISSSSAIVVSNAATASTTVSATVFPWGNGNGSTTFTLPDMRGRTLAGADAMGGTAASRLTSTYYGSVASAPSVAGGSQSHTLTVAESAALTYTSTVTDPGHTHNAPFNGQFYSFVGSAGAFGTAAGSNVALGATTITSATGVTVATTSNAGGGAHSIVQPTLTINYIIKAKPNTTGAGGVVSLGGMFGDIVCDTTFACAPVAGVNTIGLASQNALTMLANTIVGSAQPTGVTLTQWLDATCGGTQGDIIYRSASAWNCLPPGTNGQVLATQGPGANPHWFTTSGIGTVTSVGLALPSSVFAVTGSPVTLAGTLTGSFATQSANTIFAGPTSGGAAVPAFRASVLDDLPTIGNNTVIGNVSGVSAKPVALSQAQLQALVGSGVLPNGGTKGDILVKNSSANGDASWYKTEIDAAAYGVVCDGVTDNATAINAAITAASPGNSVILPAGVCGINSPVVIPINSGNISYIKLTGHGTGTQLKLLSGFSGTAAIVVHGSLTTISDMYIEGSGKAADGIYYDAWTGGPDWPSWAQRLLINGFSVGGHCGINIYGIHMFVLDNRIDNSSSGVCITRYGVGTMIRGNDIIATNYGIYMKVFTSPNPEGVFISSNGIGTNNGIGIYAGSFLELKITNNIIDDSTTASHSLYVDCSCTGLMSSGNWFGKGVFFNAATNDVNLSNNTFPGGVNAVLSGVTNFKILGNTFEGTVTPQSGAQLQLYSTAIGMVVNNVFDDGPNGFFNESGGAGIIASGNMFNGAASVSFGANICLRGNYNAAVGNAAYCASAFPM